MMGFSGMPWIQEAKIEQGGTVLSLASLDPTVGGNFPVTVPGPNSTGGARAAAVAEVKQGLLGLGGQAT